MTVHVVTNVSQYIIAIDLIHINHSDDLTFDDLVIYFVFKHLVSNVGN